MTEPPQKKQRKQKILQKVENPKPLILNFFEALTPVLHAPGQWRNPRDQSRNYTKPDYWVKLAQLAERGKLHGIFFGDSLAPYGGYKSQGLGGPFNFTEAARTGNNFPKNDPTAYLSAIAVSTKNISVGFTCSTLSEHPYHFARRAATLDHLSGGRFGWNVVTSFVPAAGRNLADDNKHPDKNIRYEKADEYLQVVYELLLSSWRDDGVVFDREKGIFSNPDAIREINFEGKYFKVPGPQITEPSPQRIPLIIQAGASPLGLRLGAKHAELIYVGGKSPEAVKNKILETKKLAKELYKRNPDHLKFVMRIAVVVEETSEQAKAKFDEIQSYKDIEGIQVQIGGSGFDLSKYDWDEDLSQASDEAGRRFAALQKEFHHGKTITRRLIANSFMDDNTFVGSPTEVADEIEDWVARSGVDGFNLTNVVFPETFENIVDLLIPELQQRGLAQREYAVEGGTFREQIYGKGNSFVPKDHYAHDLRWEAGVSKQDFEQRIAQLKEGLIKDYKITADLA